MDRSDGGTDICADGCTSLLSHPSSSEPSVAILRRRQRRKRIHAHRPIRKRGRPAWPLDRRRSRDSKSHGGDFSKRSIRFQASGDDDCSYDTMQARAPEHSSPTPPPLPSPVPRLNHAHASLHNMRLLYAHVRAGPSGSADSITLPGPDHLAEQRAVRQSIAICIRAFMRTTLHV
ncbi:hypothetical protein RJ55_07684 [Drechmeria coniospora]|nr:hypothetical protein RJ55_07684 [Drechmeria coniospora]